MKKHLLATTPLIIIDCFTDRTFAVSPVRTLSEENQPSTIAKIPHLLRYIERCLFCFRSSNKIVLESESRFTGRKIGARMISKLLQLQFFEFHENDDFKEQMFVALRIEKPLLLYIDQKSLSDQNWVKMINLVKTEDILSILSFDEVFSIIGTVLNKIPISSNNCCSGYFLRAFIILSTMR